MLSLNARKCTNGNTIKPEKNATEVSAAEITAADEVMFSFLLRYEPYVINAPIPSESEKKACFKPSTTV
jgi:hypothetical protein